MVSHTGRPFGILVIAGVLAGALACGSDSSVTSQGYGTLEIHLTDAPFPTDSVSRVDLFIVRVDGKQEESDSMQVARGASDDSANVDGWMTLATPRTKVELLGLRDGVSSMIGSATVAAGSYRSFRLVIDPSLSSVTLKNGTVLTSNSSPSVAFPSAARSGIKIELDHPIAVAASSATPLLVDFDVAQSFVLRGNSLAQNGLLFKPVIRGTVKE